MKILITTQYFYPENFRINDFAFKMAQRGHEVSVLTGTPNYPAGKNFGNYKTFACETINGVQVYRVPLIPRGKSRGFELAINYISFLASALVFGPILLRKSNPDIVFSVNYSPATVGLVGAFFSKIKRVPMFLWVQDLWPDSLQATGAVRSRLALSFVGSMVSWIYGQSALIFIQSKSFSRYIECQGTIDPEKIKYFPNWAEDTYDISSSVDVHHCHDLIPRDKFIIMFAGNLGVAQALENVVRAADLCRDYPIHWVFLGDGREKDTLHSAVRDFDLEDHVSLLGRYPLEDMPHFFELADVMLVTLKKDPVFSITIPGKIQSYLKSGKPILSSLDGEGAIVVVDSGAGVNVSSGDYVGLADAAVKLSTLTPEALSEMGNKAKDYYAEVFDVNKLLAQFERDVKPCKRTN